MSDKPQRKKFRQEDVIASHIHRPLALEIVRLLWDTNITANQITLFRVVLNIISLILFAQGTLFGFVGGFIFFQVHEVLDTVDGMYSRYKKQTSKLGAYLEYFFDDLFSTANGLFGFAIAYGAYSATGDFIYIWLFISITIAHSLSLAYVIHFEKEKICQEDSLHNIDHDNETYPALFGVGFKKGMQNFIFTVVVWKNELLLWGSLFFMWGLEQGIDFIFWALVIHAFIFNAFWIRRAYSGYVKAKEMDKL